MLIPVSVPHIRIQVSTQDELCLPALTHVTIDADWDSFNIRKHFSQFGGWKLKMEISA